MPRSWFLNEAEASDKQRTIIRTAVDRSFAVSGSAGTGKTLLAVWRAAELEKNGLDYLVIVYTKLLKEFIAGGAEEAGLDSNKVYYFEEWERCEYPKADYIIADEVQDFDIDKLNLLRQAAHLHFIVFGDSKQQIYEGAPFIHSPLLTVEDIATKFSLRKFLLEENYRLTKKVARVAKEISALNDEFYVDLCQYEGDSKPKLVRCSNRDNIYKFIINRIQKMALDDVGVLLSRNTSVTDVATDLENLGFPNEKKDGPGNNGSNISFNSTLPKIMTMHSAKGLQFETVFLPFFTFQNDNDVWKRVKYVAFTRTYKHVYVLYIDENPFDGIVSRELFDIMNGNDFDDIDTPIKSITSSYDLDSIDDDLPF